MKKIILWGLLAGLLMMILGMAVGQIFYLIDPELKIMYENESMFRSMEDPLMSLFGLYPFVLAVILAWLWTKTKSLFGEMKPCKAGATFGLVYALLNLPGLIINISSFPIPVIMPLSWFLSLALQGIVAGLIFSKTLK